MGQAHILWIYNDGIEPQANHPQLSHAIGRAVMQVCDQAFHSAGTPREQPIRHAAVLNHANAVNHVAEVSSHLRAVFVWAGNCLRPLDALDAEELLRVKARVDAQCARHGIGAAEVPQKICDTAPSARTQNQITRTSKETP